MLYGSVAVGTRNGQIQFQLSIVRTRNYSFYSEFEILLIMTAHGNTTVWKSHRQQRCTTRVGSMGKNSVVERKTVLVVAEARYIDVYANRIPVRFSRPGAIAQF